MSDNTLITHNVQRGLSKMILEHPFYAALVLMTPVVATDDIPTAGTDGDKIYYNPAFMESLSREAVIFVLAHEVEHIVRLHCLRVESRNKEKWNVAADHGINLDLIAAGMKGPVDDEGRFAGLADKQYAGMAAEKVYNLLPDQPPPQPTSGGEGEGGGKDTGEGEGNAPNTNPNNVFAGDVMAPKDADGKPAGKARKAALDREVRGRVMQAAAQVKASNGIGSIPQHLRGLLAELGQAKVDWRKELREFVTAKCASDYSWARLNRRVRHRGLRMPSLYSEHIGGIAVMIDTSGSCYRAIPQFLSELLAVATDAKPETIHVLFVDTHIQEYIEATPDNFEADMGSLLRNPPHGGGTDLRTGFSWIEEHTPDIEAVICLTDMMTPWPETFAHGDNTLFVDTDDNAEPPPFGRKVTFTD